MLMMGLKQDLHYAWRLLSRSPGFAILAVTVLALGISTLSAGFSVVDAILLRPLPFAKSEDLVMLWEAPPGYSHNHVSPLNFLDWHDQNHVFSALAGISGGDRTLQTKEGPEKLPGQAVTSEFFRVLGIKPLAGRDFTATDDLTQANVVIISERLWRTHFSADPNLLGKSLTLSGKPATIIGVVPAQFQFLWTSDVWPLFTVKRSPEQRRMHFLRVVGRVKPGIPLTKAQADMDVIANDIARISPDTNKDWGISMQPLRSALISPELRATSQAVFGVVGFFLLLACANVANLLLARGVFRTRELALRVALGASGRRLRRQLLTESLLLGALGGCLGLGLTWLIIRAALRIIPADMLPTGISLALDLRVAFFVLGLILFTGFVCGLAPAWMLARTSLRDAILTGGHGSTFGHKRLLGVIAGGQLAVGVMIVAASVLFLRTVEKLNNVDPGFYADHVLTMQVVLPLSRYATPQRAVTFYDAVQKDIATLPGVRSASFGGSLPLAGWEIGQGFEVVGEPARSESNAPAAHYQIVGAQYFETLGIPVETGRVFSEHDTANAPQVAIVNEEFVRHYLHGRPALGTHIRVEAMDPGGPKMVEREIVGVIHQVKVEGLGEKQNDAEIYVPITQNPWFFASFAVRVLGEPHQFFPAVKAAIAKYDPELVLTNVRTMEEVAQQSIVEPQFRAKLVAGFGILALSLAAVGIFSVMAFSVAQRTREFSIRMALGAQLRNVFDAVFSAALKIIVVGIFLGTVGAAALARFVSVLLFGIRPWDSLTFVVAPTVLLVVAIAASGLPMMRALRTNPAVVLRQE